MSFISIVLFLCFIRLSAQKSTAADSTYVAAVVEYKVQSDETTNLRNYLQLIEDAAKQNADIIVFPEMTLTRGSSVVVPIYGLLREYPIPASHPDKFDEILVSISAAAQRNRIYVVINVQELMDCRDGKSPGENCPKQKQYRFNTNVVFDRNGAVIDRYRKINLFGESSRMAALAPDLGVFSTDFGVTFGHFICFDLMFQVPSIQVVQKNNITDVIFPTMWFSELPYLTAVQIQQAYAHTMNVNFLAAGANNVRVGSSGSGIYSGKAGALVSLMTGVPTTRLLVAEVPKVPGQVDGTYPGPIYDDPTDQDNLRLKTDPSLLSHVSRLLETGFEEFTLEDRDVYCHFKVRLSQRNGKKTPRYRAFVHDGTNVYAKRHLGTVGCVIVSCEDEDLKSCYYRFNKTEEENMGIDELEIEMTSYRTHYNSTLKCDDAVYYPISLRTNKFPLNPQNYTFNIDENRHFYTLIDNDIIQDDQQYITYKLNSPQTELLSFGIWGRIYREDGKDNKEVIDQNVKPHAEIENSLLGVQEDSATKYRYRALAISGVRTFDEVASGAIKVCSIVACTGKYITSCGKRFSRFSPNSTGIFEELSITARVPTPVTDVTLNASNTTYFPVSLDTRIMPLKPEDHTYTETNLSNGTSIYEFNLKNVKNVTAELYAIGIWGRDYTLHVDDVSPPLDDIDYIRIFAILTSFAMMMQNVS